MADDPLDEWRETLAEDRKRVGFLPQGPVKNSLRRKLRDIEVVLQVVGGLPENEPFRCRVEDVARLMKKTPSTNIEEWGRIANEFADCVRIARIMKQRHAALDAWPSSADAKFAPTKGE